MAAYESDTMVRRVSLYRHQRRRRLPHHFAVPMLMLLGGAAGTGYFSDGFSFSGLAAALPGSGCEIKGNVSIESGERIYHVPGQEYYSETNIAAEWGERWFCSEAEARNAGWRKSKR